MISVKDSSYLKSYYWVVLAFLIALIGTIYFLYFHSTKVNSWQLATSIRWLKPRLSISKSTDNCSNSIKTASFCKTTITSTERKTIITRLASFQGSFTLHEKALFHVIKDSDYKQILGLLAESIVNHPDSAELWNDVAAINLASGTQDEEWTSLERALSASKTALEINPNYANAQLNHALTLEALQLDEQAIKAWEKAEKLSKTDWSTESHSHLKALQKHKTNSNKSNSFATIHNQIKELMRGKGFLKDFIEHPTSFCKTEVNQWLKIGQLIKSSYKDDFILKSVDWICNDSSATTKWASQELYKSVQDYASGKFALAHDRLTKIQNDFPKDSPLCEMARSLKASSSFALTQLIEAKKSLLSNSNWRCSNKTSAFFEARNSTLLGSIALRNVDVEHAINYYQNAVKLLDNTGENEAFARATALLGEAYSKANRPNIAWHWQKKALEIITSNSLDRKSLPQICGFLAETASALGVFHIQSAYANCFHNNLTKNHPPYLHALAYLFQAEAKVSLKRDANKELNSALKIINKHQLGVDSKAHYEYINGRNIANLSPSLALASMQRVQKSYAQQNNKELEIRARSSQIILQGDDRNEANLKTLALMASNIQASTKKLDINLSLERRFRPIHEMRIESFLAQNQWKKALSSLLQARGVVVKNTENYIDFIAESHHPKNASLVLALINGKISGWLIDSGGVKKAFQKSLKEAESVIALASASYSNVSYHKRKEALSKLYNSIISPIEPELQNYNNLSIIPDDMLFGIPFPALLNSTKQKYLIEIISMTVSPELTLSSNKSSVKTNTAVIIDASNADNTRQLPFAKIEASNVKNILQKRYSAKLFQGRSVTKKHFLNAIQNASIVHFSGHGEIDKKQPELSRLIFGSGAQSALLAEDLYNLPNGANSKLVTLAACDTAAYSSKQPHALALIRPLLDSGVGYVIGSLKPISDRRYTRMMKVFYEELISSDDIPSSFRKMQLSEIKLARFKDPINWAAINLFAYIQ